MKTKRFFLYSFTPVLLLVLIALTFSLMMNRSAFKSNEEPFISLVAPFKEVNSSVFFALGDQIRGPRVVVVRVVDLLENEWYLAALKSSHPGKFESVLINPQIEWVEGRGFNLGLSLEALFEKQEQLSNMNDANAAVTDMVRLLEEHRENGQSEHAFALEYLKGKR